MFGKLTGFAFLVVAAAESFGYVFAPEAGKSSWRDADAVWSVGRQDGKDPWVADPVVPLVWTPGMTLSAKCADRTPHASPATVVDFTGAEGLFTLDVQATLKNQIPPAGYGRVEWFVVGANGKVYSVASHQTALGGNGVAELSFSTTVPLRRTDVLRMRIQTVNPGPAPADNTWLFVKRMQIEKFKLKQVPVPADRRPQIALKLKPTRGAVSVPEVDGPVLPDAKPDMMLESFETTRRQYSFEKMRGEPNIEVEERDGIATHGSRSLHVDMRKTLSKDPNGYHEAGIFWRFEGERDFSGYDGLMFKMRVSSREHRGFNLILEEPDGTLWQRGFAADQSKPNVWQTIVLPMEFGRYHEGVKAPNGKKKSDLRHIRSLRLRLMGFVDEPYSFDIDEIALVRSRPVYQGPTIRFDGDPRRHDGTEFVFDTLVGGEPNDQPLRAVFMSVDYFGTTNYLGETELPMGLGAARGTLRIPNEGPGFRRLIGVLLDGDGHPVYRKSRGFSTILGLRPEDRARNPDSIFGIWVGGGAPLEVGAKWTRTYVRAHELGADPKILEKKPVSPLRTCPQDADSCLVFSYMPRWLSVKGPDDPDGRRYPSKDWKGYEKYISWVTENTPGYDIYEMWNEPVPHAYWMGSVADLVPLAEATYRGMKAVKPKAKLLGPCPYSFLIPFMDEFFEKGGGKWLDGIVVHGYTPGPPDVHFVKGLSETKALLCKHGLENLPLYITEMGYSTPSVSEDDMAAYIPRCYAYAWREGVKFMVWHNLEALSSDGVSFDLSWKDKTPRPGFTAFCVMTRELEGAKLVRQMDGLPKSVVAFEFVRRGVKTVLFWDKEASRGVSGSGVSFDVAAGKKPMLVNLMGGEIRQQVRNGRVALRAQRDPAYLRFD